MLSLSEEQAAKGVVVHSSGNHAAAVALAAKIHSIPAHIVLPTDAPQVCSFCSNAVLQRVSSVCAAPF